MAIPSFIIFLLSLISMKPTAAFSPRLAVNLIHPSSISQTPTTISNASPETTNYRLNYLRAKAARGTIISNVTPILRPLAFLANVSIGDPPVPQLLYIDTGSDLLWLQCNPCAQCYHQYLPIFNPPNSSSYHNIPCGSSPSSSSTRLVTDQQTGTCRYFLGYLDGTRTKGVIAKEKLTFHTADDGLSFLSDVVFGCGHENSGFSSLYTGLLGLGPGPFSLVNTLESKFSYCFGSLTDPNYPHNLLIFGDDARTDGDSTPLDVFNDLYYVNLEAISVGDKTLQIDPLVFQRTKLGSGGTIIDTGFSLTYLAGEAYERLKEEVENLLGGKFTRVGEQRRFADLCYKGNAKRDLIGFPTVTFRFSGGAELVLDVESLFVDYGHDSFCLTVNRNTNDDLNVISATAQQNYNVGYDLDDMKVYFQRIDCELLSD